MESMQSSEEKLFLMNKPKSRHKTWDIRLYIYGVAELALRIFEQSNLTLKENGNFVF